MEVTQTVEIVRLVGAPGDTVAAVDVGPLVRAWQHAGWSTWWRQNVHDVATGHMITTCHATRRSTANVR